VVVSQLPKQHFETTATTSDPEGLKCLQSEPGGCDEQPPNLLSVDKNLRKRSPSDHVTAKQRATRPVDFKEKRFEEYFRVRRTFLCPPTMQPPRLFSVAKDLRKSQQGSDSR
jgi:hypothetical protein